MVNLYHTYNWYNDQVNGVFRQYNILSQHFNILKIIQGKSPQPCTAKDIKERIMDKGRDITRFIDKLVSLGYVERNLNPENRREMHISLTQKGKETTQKINQELITRIRELDALTEEESDQLYHLLDKVRAQ